MADFAAHTLFGEMVHVKASQWAAYPTIRNWGLQGPDILFFRRAISGGGPLHCFGSEMHSSNISKQFYEMAHYINHLPALQRDAAIAYFYGFLCHYSLDSIIHPYVEHHVGRLKTGFPELTEGAIHCQIETDMDIDLYTYLRKVPVNRFSPGELYTVTREQSELIGCIVSVTIYNTYGIALPAAEIMAAVGDTLRTTKALYAPTKLIHAAAGLAETLMHKEGQFTSHVKAYKPKWDSLNLRGSGWYSPFQPERRRTETVIQLMELAARKAEGLIAAYAEMFATGEIKELEYDVTYEGVPVIAPKV
ncbi:MAG: zinc dependent phospholipase C family protein [Angelakisella sp.]|nr:zinc dependent phospholipase C family protein [Angelakisella sp.]